MDKLLSETQVADVLQVTPACLRAWRRVLKGPRFIRVGAGVTKPRIRYKELDIEAWVEDRAVATSTDAELRDRVGRN
jgi:hypothetical protein